MDTKFLENCKIAVCLSGQSRTFENCSSNIKEFFSSHRNNKFYFFGHTWDTNTYKVKVPAGIAIKKEKINDLKLFETNLRNHFNFTELVVEEEIYRPYPWASMLYSMMRSNFLKQKYEAENNMMFDLVVRARFDVCYQPGTHFEDYVHAIEEKCIYSNYGIMRGEFFLPNPDDVIYFGSSLTMDLVDSLYNIVCDDNKFDKIFNYNIDNLVYRKVGVGPLLHKWSTIKNILPKHIVIPYAVRRFQSRGVKDWTTLDKIHRLIF